MYLSRLILNARTRDARAWLGDCHALHRVVMSGFPDIAAASPRADLGVLFRVEPMTAPPYVPVLIQSRAEPAWRLETNAVAGVEGPKSLSTLLDRISAGKRYRFRLRASPTRRVHGRATLGADPARGRMRPEKAEAKGKRVELTREADRIAWLERRAEAAGFRIVTAHLLPGGHDVPALLASGAGKTKGRKDGAGLTLATVLFDGLLEVRDADRFRNALRNGIGPGKAFGCGLLSIAPVQEVG
jgi:CRISPR system Cascade subunit CasE